MLRDLCVDFVPFVVKFNYNSCGNQMGPRFTRHALRFMLIAWRRREMNYPGLIFKF